MSEGPWTWNENGDLVPFDAVERQRQLKIAEEQAKENKSLPDNPVLSDRQSLRLVWRDAAGLLDELFKNNLEAFVQIGLPILALVIGGFARSFWAALILLFPSLCLVAWRYWVWVKIERKK